MQAVPALHMQPLQASPPLQLVLAKTSLPDAPSVMFSGPAETQANTDEPRRPYTGVAVFAIMICAAAVPLGRYALRGESESAPTVARVRASTAAVRQETAPPPSQDSAAAQAVAPAPVVPAEPPHVDRLPEIMAGLPAEAAEASEYLVDHAVRARDSGEFQLAETLLGRASELDGRNPHPAFALAQLRFEQGNYEGAEGWIVNAIRLRPRRAEYRTLYANVLSRLGRESEARDERRRAQRLHD